MGHWWERTGWQFGVAHVSEEQSGHTSIVAWQSEEAAESSHTIMYACKTEMKWVNNKRKGVHVINIGEIFRQH